MDILFVAEMVPPIRETPAFNVELMLFAISKPPLDTVRFPPSLILICCPVRNFPPLFTVIPPELFTFTLLLTLSVPLETRND